MYERPSRKSEVDLRKRGRPKKNDLRDRAIKIYVTGEEYFNIKQLADHYNKSLSDCIRYCCRRQISEVKLSGFTFEKYEKK